MGSSLRGCGLLQVLSWVLCYNTINADYNDETVCGNGGRHYIFALNSGKILHGFQFFPENPGCFSTLTYDLIIPDNDNSLNRIETFNSLGEEYLIAVGDSGTILRADTISGVITFDQINCPSNNNLSGLCKSGFSIFAVGDAGTVIKSVDFGITWTQLNFPFNVDLNDCSSPAEGEVICVGSSYFAAYRTTDYGDTWEQINFGEVVPESAKSKQGVGLQRVYCFDNNISYIIGAGLVFRTNDNWNSYEFQDPGTTEQLNDVFFVAPDTGVIIGNNGTARFTSDGGQNWFEDPDITVALNGTTLKRIIKQADDFGLVVGEGGLSVAFARDSTAFITSTDEEQKVVTEYSLSQNYPNPFNPTTTIKYELPFASYITLKVFDLLGNEIATLVNEEKTTGVYEVEFSAIGGSASGGNTYSLPSGIYFYKITAGNYSETKKLVLLK
jgi:photosystem II stability/assembly factor-like uncharacterized protein